MVYDVIITGVGIAGLTAAAYLCKSGYKVLICEKEKKVGGLVNSFNYKGFTFDGGIRAIENSGIIMPMLRQLGIDIDFVKNNVSIGIEKDTIRLVSKESISDYQNLLNSQFPQSTEDVDRIILDVKKVMKYMDVLYGIDNPLFLDFKKDRKYILKTILPWLFKYIFTFKKIQKLDVPIDEYLHRLTDDEVLIDMIAQHFFQKTPAFFALSYFSLYLDYQYPKGGTGVLTEKLEQFIRSHNGEIRTETKISGIDFMARRLTDSNGNHLYYKKLIWASDLKKLYKMIDIDTIIDLKVKQRIAKMKADVSDKLGGDSIFTLYLTVDLDKSFFENICSGHFFYTPHKKGLMNADIKDIMEKSGNRQVYITDKQAISEWIKNFYNLTTFEISIPVMRDESLAPQGKTGLIISTLFEYSLVKHIEAMGWYDEFKSLSTDSIISVLDSTVFPGLKDKIMDNFASTPLTLEKITGNSEGAITGWAFTNSFIPVLNSLPKVARSVVTPIPDVIQAGQWTFSPSGLPISILTGKLAGDSGTDSGTVLAVH
ncbi:MAG: phytoene desaturase family protein [Saccharofermentanales bacterium]